MTERVTYRPRRASPTLTMDDGKVECDVDATLGDLNAALDRAEQIRPLLF